MFEVIAKSAAIASLAIAALPFIALGAAHAQTATVRVSDLSLSRPAHVQVLNGRIDQAADKFCADYADQRDLGRVAACKSAVRAELQEKAKAASVTVASR